jgi:3-isopropylmalate dehydrogenase
LWRSVVQEVAKQYPDVTVEHMFVDSAAMKLIQNPRSFDVVVTGNLFGDILTDEASQIAGSMGMLASASIGDKVGLYEPIHGSAHDITGKGIANPLASILSAALMLDISFGMKEESGTIIKAVEKTLQDGYRTRDIASESTPHEKILGTDVMGNVICNQVRMVATVLINN